MIICGYCETQQNGNNPKCQSCGGPLNDDITVRRNQAQEDAAIYCPDPNRFNAWVKVGETSGLTAREFNNQIRNRLLR